MPSIVPMAAAAQREAQHLLLLEVERVEEITERLHHRRTGGLQRLDPAIEQCLRVLAPEVLVFDQRGELGTPEHVLRGTADGEDLFEQVIHPFDLGGVQVEEGRGAGPQGDAPWTRRVLAVVPVMVIVESARVMERGVPERAEAAVGVMPFMAMEAAVEQVHVGVLRCVMCP